MTELAFFSLVDSQVQVLQTVIKAFPIYGQQTVTEFGSLYWESFANEVGFVYLFFCGKKRVCNALSKCVFIFFGSPDHHHRYITLCWI